MIDDEQQPLSEKDEITKKRAAELKEEFNRNISVTTAKARAHEKQYGDAQGKKDKQDD